MVFTSPLPALPGSPPGFSLGSYFHHVLGSASDSPCLWFPRMAFKFPPILGLSPSPFSILEAELHPLVSGKSSIFQAAKNFRTEICPNSPFQSVPPPGAFCPSPSPSTTDQRNWTSSRSFPFIQCSHHGPAHGQASFPLPLPFPCRIDLFSFNSLIFSFPRSGAVSSDPWWEAFCLGLNQDGLGREAGGGKKKERRKKNIPPGKTQSSAHTTSFSVYYL